MDEATKYEEVWKHGAYRRVAPGEHHVQRFIELTRPTNASSICDFGCGTGRAAQSIALLSGAAVSCLDFAHNCLDSGVRSLLGERFRFRQHDLSTPVGETFDYGFCTDVLEHIPPKDVDRVLTNIFTAARKTYLAISTVPDVMGELIGEPLHLTVESPFWWHDKLTSLGIRVDWSHYQEGVVCFYGSLYAAPVDFAETGRLNEEESKVRENVRRNLSIGLKEICPHQKQDTVVYLLAGGPSLADFEDQIIEAGKAGTPIVTVNGTYKWLLDRGIRPAAQVMMDARSFNRKFVEPLVDTCKYLMSSQCDYELVSSLPPEQTWLWHGHSDLVEEVVDEWCRENASNREWWPVYGGTTVVTRAIVMLAMLGFRKVEIFGWDSCLIGENHHAYPQPENDSKRVIGVTFGGREFKCHPWMIVQAHDFPNIVRGILAKIPDFDMEIHGDGLLAWMIKHTAEEAESKGD